MEQGPESDRQRRDRVLSRDPDHASGRENRPREGGRCPPSLGPAHRPSRPRLPLDGPRRLRDAAGEWTWARRTPPWRLERGELPTRPPWLAPAVALLAAALTAAAPVAAATSRHGAPLLWRIERYGRRSYLFGTVHLPLD